MSAIKFLGLGGSLRSNSISAVALKHMLDLLAARGHETELLLLSDLRLPGYGTFEWLENYPQSVEKLLNAVRSADGIVLSTPVYHGTISGGLKNALDFLEFLANDPKPYLEGKVAGLISTSGDMPGINAINTMENICHALHAWVCPTAIAVSHSYIHFDESGKLKDQKIMNRFLQLASELEFAARKFQA